MKKTIFTKIFSINLVIIIVSVLVLAVMQSIMISQYVYKERISSLKENARTIAAYIQNGTAPEKPDQLPLRLFPQHQNKHYYN